MSLSLHNRLAEIFNEFMSTDDGVKLNTLEVLDTCIELESESLENLGIKLFRIKFVEKGEFTFEFCNRNTQLIELDVTTDFLLREITENSIYGCYKINVIEDAHHYGTLILHEFFSYDIKVDLSCYNVKANFSYASYSNIDRYTNMVKNHVIKNDINIYYNLKSTYSHHCDSMFLREVYKSNYTNIKLIIVDEIYDVKSFVALLSCINKNLCDLEKRNDIRVSLNISDYISSNILICKEVIEGLYNVSKYMDEVGSSNIFGKVKWLYL